MRKLRFKMEIANNNVFEDWKLSGKTERIDFTGKTMELKIPVSSEAVAKRLIENTEATQNLVKEIKKELKFSKLVCRFDFEDFKPSEQLQKELSSFQETAFDEVTIQMIDGDFNTFKSVFEHSLNKSKLPVSTLIDLNQHPQDLQEYCQYFVAVRPANTKWIYHKIDSNMQKYRIVSGILQEAKVDYILTGCRPRCSIKNFENIAVSVIARAYFGFKGCCLEFNHSKPDKKTKRRGFSPTMDYFNPETCEFERVPNKDYRKNRIGNFQRLNELDISQDSIKQIKKVNLLFQNLQKL